MFFRGRTFFFWRGEVGIFAGSEIALSFSEAKIFSRANPRKSIEINEESTNSSALGGFVPLRSGTCFPLIGSLDKWELAISPKK